MSRVEDHLQRWRAAGLVDEALARQIEAFERSPGPAPSTGFQRPSVLEAVLYIGLVIAAQGVLAFVGSNWDELQSWARVSVVAVPALLALAGGFAMRTYADPAIQRGGQVAWLLGTGLAGGAAVVVSEEYGRGADDHLGLLVAGIVTLALAVALWAIGKAHLQAVAVAGAAGFFAMTTGNLTDDFNPPIAACVGMFLGAALIAATERDVFTPRFTARLASGALLAGTAFFVQVNSSIAWEVATPLAVTALITLSVTRASFTYMVVGVGLVFMGLMAFIGEHFEGVGPLAFVLAGTLIVAGVLLLARLRPHFRGGPA